MAGRVDVILRAARHLQVLLDDVLDISAIEASRLVLSAETVPATEVLEQRVLHTECKNRNSINSALNHAPH